MQPASPQFIAEYKAKSALSTYSASVATTLEPYEHDPVPPANARGGRTADGWRMVFKGVITRGPCRRPQAAL